MSKESQEITYSEHVFKKHISKGVIPKVQPYTRMGVFLRAIIRSHYLFPEKTERGAQRADNYLTKTMVKMRLEKFEKLNKDMQKDYAQIILATLFNAYKNEDRMRMIDLIIRQTRQQVYDPSKSLVQNLDEQTNRMKPGPNTIQSILLQNKQRKLEREQRIFPYLNMGDIQVNIGRTTTTLIECIHFMTMFAEHFPPEKGGLNKTQVRLFGGQLLTISTKIKRFAEERDKKSSQNHIDAFYYLIKLAIQKHEKTNSEVTKTRVDELAKLLSLKNVSVDSLPRNFSRGKKYINSLPEIRKLKVLEKQLSS